MFNISNKISSITNRFKARYQDVQSDVSESNPWYKVAAGCFAGYLLIVVVLAVWWSGEPEVFDVGERVLAELQASSADADADLAKQASVTGVYTTTSLIHVVEVMLDKPGGYITNDILLPGQWMDNTPHWEFGVLVQVRDLTKALREAFSRSQSQSAENEHLARAESQFNFDNSSWLLPQTESEYRDGVKYMRLYLASLQDEQSFGTQFYARADNLRYWLSTVETRLGSLSQNLSASVGQKRLNTDLAGDAVASQATQSPRELLVKTPWSEIDDEFYKARGSTWALIHFLKAIEVDFSAVLEKKNAKVSLQQIIRELEATQQDVGSPMILNGDGFGMLANHSLVMASYISRANAAIIDLRELLSQG